MNVIDQRGRLFGRINILDLLLILAVALTAGKLAYDRLNVNEIIAPPLDNVQIEFKAYAIDPIGSNVQIGQKVTDKRTGVYIGTIKERSIKPMEPGLIGTNGAPYAEIRLLIENKATVTAAAYQVGALELRAGDSITLLGPQYSLTGSITALSKQD